MIENEKNAYFVHKLNGQLSSYKFTTFTLKYNQVDYFSYYCNQTGNMWPYYPFEDD